MYLFIEKNTTEDDYMIVIKGYKVFKALNVVAFFYLLIINHQFAH